MKSEKIMLQLYHGVFFVLFFFSAWFIFKLIENADSAIQHIDILQLYLTVSNSFFLFWYFSQSPQFDFLKTVLVFFTFLTAIIFKLFKVFNDTITSALTYYACFTIYSFSENITKITSTSFTISIYFSTFSWFNIFCHFFWTPLVQHFQLCFAALKQTNKKQKKITSFTFQAFLNY